MKQRRFRYIAILLVLPLLFTACASVAHETPDGESVSETIEMPENTQAAAPVRSRESEITLTIDGKPLSVEWVDNSTVDALRKLLEKGDVTLEMSDYAGFEKGAPLPEILPQNNEPMNADAGDVILYQGRQFVIYYDQNSWSLTPLGKITGMTKMELQTLLGTGNVTVILSLV